MKKKTSIALVIFLFAIILVGISVPASALSLPGIVWHPVKIVWHPASADALKATDKNVAKNTTEIKKLNSTVAKNGKATDKRITAVEKKDKTQDDAIAEAKQTCAKCGSQPTKKGGKPGAKSSAVKKSSASKAVATKPAAPAAPSIPLPKSEYADAVRDNINDSQEMQAEMSWMGTENGLRTAIFCTVAYGGITNVSYDRSQKEFKDGCIAFVYDNSRNFSFLKPDDLRELASLYATQESESKTRKAVSAEAAETRRVVVAEATMTQYMVAKSELEIIRDNASQTVTLEKAIWSEHKNDTANILSAEVWGSFASLYMDPGNVALQNQFCGDVANSILKLQQDRDLLNYYQQGYVDFLAKNDSICAAPISAKKKKDRFKKFGFFAPLVQLVTSATNYVAKVTVKPLTHGFCVNEGHSPDCKLDGGQILVGGITTVMLGRAVLSDWALYKLGWKKKPQAPPPTVNNGNGPSQPSPSTGNGPSQPTVPTTSGSPGGTGNQNYPNPPGSQVPPSTGTPPPMTNGAVNLPGQSITGISNPSNPGVFTPAATAGRSSLPRINDSRGPAGPSTRDFGSAFN